MCEKRLCVLPRYSNLRARTPRAATRSNFHRQITNKLTAIRKATPFASAMRLVQCSCQGGLAVASICTLPSFARGHRRRKGLRHGAVQPFPLLVVFGVGARRCTLAERNIAGLWAFAL